MHDDERPVTPESEEPESYWTEAQWEQSMLENETLMDRYEQVMRENSERHWGDPLDLYHKVHDDLDLGEEKPEPPSESESIAAKPPERAEEPLYEKDDVHEIPAYRLAFDFAMATLDYMKRFEHEQRGQNPLREQCCHHALRIAADIAGGHGMGYEEDALCGNIVKNRWALAHAQEAQRLLRALIERDESAPDLAALLAATSPIIKALEERIAELRAKVWWQTHEPG